MAIVNKRTMYPFSECIRVQTNGTTPVHVMPIPAGTIIERVMARVTIAATGTPGNFMAGDYTPADVVGDADGFIAAIASGGGVITTVIGDVGAELGAYLYDSTEKKDRVKLYSSAGYDLTVELSAATATIEPTLDILVTGHRYAV